MEIAGYIQRKKGLNLIKQHPYLLMYFKELIEKPLLCAVLIQDFLGQILNIDAMSKIAEKRQVSCIDNMLEEQLYL